jgi:hypothetical protein
MTRRSSLSTPTHSSLARADNDVPPQVSIAPVQSPLVERARDFLTAGPAGSVPLIEHVCRLPGAPPAVAEQLALALFMESSDVRREADGRWALVRERPATKFPRCAVPARSIDALTFVVVDVETTGGSLWGGDRITEFCAVTLFHLLDAAQIERRLTAGLGGRRAGTNPFGRRHLDEALHFVIKIPVGCTPTRHPPDEGHTSAQEPHAPSNTLLTASETRLQRCRWCSSCRRPDAVSR